MLNLGTGLGSGLGTDLGVRVRLLDFRSVLGLGLGLGLVFGCG